MARAVAPFYALLLLVVSVNCLTDPKLPAILFPFGTDEGDSVVPVGDDESSPVIHIPTARFKFFNITRNTVYVSLSVFVFTLLHDSLTRFFTALHGMQTRSSNENSASPSVRLTVCQTRAL